MTGFEQLGAALIELVKSSSRSIGVSLGRRFRPTTGRLPSSPRPTWWERPPCPDPASDPESGRELCPQSAPFGGGGQLGDRAKASKSQPAQIARGPRGVPEATLECVQRDSARGRPPTTPKSPLKLHHQLLRTRPGRLATTGPLIRPGAPQRAQAARSPPPGRSRIRHLPSSGPARGRRRRCAAR